MKLSVLFLISFFEFQWKISTMNTSSDSMPSFIGDETPAHFGDGAFLQKSANTTFRTEISSIDPTAFPPGSFFPNFRVQELSRWPNPQWPRSAAWSRRVITARARQHMEAGAILILFSSVECPRCADVLGLCEELGIPAAWVKYDEAGGGARLIGGATRGTAP